MSRRSLVFILIIGASLIIYLLWPSDEARIKKLFKEGVKAVETRKPDDVMSKISFTYTDERGLSYLIIKDSLTRVFREMSGISIEYEITRMDIRDEKATADLDIRV
ncbi:MAG: hypothetical protein HZA17_09795, partial [Nitrospirae bacterium]|nr:hypothetical protein [Nitrospirota bacterium]